MDLTSQVGDGFDLLAGCTAWWYSLVSKQLLCLDTHLTPTLLNTRTLLLIIIVSQNGGYKL